MFVFTWNSSLSYHDPCPTCPFKRNPIWSYDLLFGEDFIIMFLLVVYSNEIHKIMHELEKEAFNQGYTLALAFVNGSCRLCSSCNLKEKICAHPSLARLPEHAVVINMKKPQSLWEWTWNSHLKDSLNP